VRLIIDGQDALFHAAAPSDSAGASGRVTVKIVPFGLPPLSPRATLVNEILPPHFLMMP
jgi:hypothetical protein